MSVSINHHPEPSRSHAVVLWALVVLLAVSPLATLVRGSTSGVVFYTSYLLSLALIVLNRHSPGFQAWCRQWRWLYVAALVFLATTLAADFHHHELFGSNFEKTIRFVMAIPILLALWQIKHKHLLALFVGLALSVLVMSLLLVFPPALLGDRPDTVQYSRLNTVEFASLLVCFAGVLFIFVSGAGARWRSLVALLKVGLLLLALYAAYLSQTRTAWLAVPVFLLFLLGLLWLKSRLLALLLLLAAFASVAYLLFVDAAFHDRVFLALEEFHICEDQPHIDNSICNRVQLIHAASNMVAEQPWLGVGTGDQYRQALMEQHQLGVVSRYVADNFGEPHNDMLYMASATGWVGLAGFVWLVYLAPLFYLVGFVSRALRVRGRVLSRPLLAACAGLFFIAAFLVFGMSEMMFRNMRVASLYAVWIAIFLAASALVSGGTASERSQRGEIKA